MTEPITGTFYRDVVDRKEDDAAIPVGTQVLDAEGKAIAVVIASTKDSFTTEPVKP